MVTKAIVVAIEVPISVRLRGWGSREMNVSMMRCIEIHK